VTLKASEVVDIAMLAHGNLPQEKAATPPGECFYPGTRNCRTPRRGHQVDTKGWFTSVNT
jgi:hypothetical protein